MALFGKKNCPNCGQPQEKNWDKCPFCAQMGGMGGGGMGMGGPPMGGGGMGQAMGGGMAPPGMGGFGGPPAPMGGGFGGGAPSAATQFGGGGGGYGGAPPGGGFGPPPGGGGYGGGTGFGSPSSGQKTSMFMTSGGQSILLGWVVPLKGPQRGELHALKGQSVIGKDPTCDIVINDSFLSSRHATIRQQGGQFVIEDHSTNGTYVNDKRVTRTELIDNDMVKFGQTLVKFKCL